MWYLYAAAAAQTFINTAGPVPLSLARDYVGVQLAMQKVIRVRRFSTAFSTNFPPRQQNPVRAASLLWRSGLECRECCPRDTAM